MRPPPPYLSPSYWDTGDGVVPDGENSASILSHVADRVLVLQPSVRPEPLRWES